jgi:hypothetical protein
VGFTRSLRAMMRRTMVAADVEGIRVRLWASTHAKNRDWLCDLEQKDRKVMVWRLVELQVLRFGGGQGPPDFSCPIQLASIIWGPQDITI